MISTKDNKQSAKKRVQAQASHDNLLPKFGNGKKLSSQDSHSMKVSLQNKSSDRRSQMARGAKIEQKLANTQS